MSDTIPTPRTDAATFALYTDCDEYIKVVYPEDMKKLERELAALTKERDELRKLGNQLYEWGSHSEACTIACSSEECTCGFGKALTAWEQLNKP